jgi:hypothetical protein
MAYRLLIDDLHRELVARGWTDVREAFGLGGALPPVRPTV